MSLQTVVINPSISSYHAYKFLGMFCDNIRSADHFFPDKGCPPLYMTTEFTEVLLAYVKIDLEKYKLLRFWGFAGVSNDFTKWYIMHGDYPDYIGYIIILHADFLNDTVHIDNAKTYIKMLNETKNNYIIAINHPNIDKNDVDRKLDEYTQPAKTNFGLDDSKKTYFLNIDDKEDCRRILLELAKTATLPEDISLEQLTELIKEI